MILCYNIAIVQFKIFIVLKLFKFLKCQKRKSKKDLLRLFFLTITPQVKSVACNFPPRPASNLRLNKRIYFT